MKYRWPTLADRLNQPLVTRRQALEQLEKVSPEIMTDYAKQELAKLRAMKYFVYILFCADGTYYTGWTTDVQRRVTVHNKGKGAKYTRSRLPVRLLWFKEYPTKSEAMKREYAIKQLSRKQKGLLTRGDVTRLS